MAVKAQTALTAPTRYALKYLLVTVVVFIHGSNSNLSVLALGVQAKTFTLFKAVKIVSISSTLAEKAKIGS